MSPSPRLQLDVALELCRQGCYHAALKAFNASSSPGLLTSEEQDLLASIYLSLGSLQAAKSAFRRAINLYGFSSERVLGLSRALILAGESEAAFHLIKDSSQLHDESLDCRVILASLYLVRGDFQASIALLESNLSGRGCLSDAYYMLGMSMLCADRLCNAKSLLIEALSIYADNVKILNLLGVALQRLGDIVMAEQLFKQAHELAPNFADCLANIGALVFLRGEHESAYTYFAKSINLDPSLHYVHCNIGRIMLDRGDITKAIACFSSCLRLSPDYIDARWNRAITLLLAGHYASGLEEYECRLKRHTHQDVVAKMRFPVWSGEWLPPGSSILLLCEQGIGDTIQFIRYVRLLCDAGIRVYLDAPSCLHSLLKLVDFPIYLAAPGQSDAMKPDYCLPLLSLLRHLDIRADRHRISRPYLEIPIKRIQFWKKKFEVEKRRVVALHWQGNPDAEKENLKGRSLPLEAFAPLARHDNVVFLSLQKGFGSEQLDNCSFRDRFVSFQKEIDPVWDFLDVAAILCCCDLLITSDSALVHLAGAIGAPAWLLLQRVPEWRWGLEGDQTFWYQNVRLFRQVKKGDWDEVINRVSESLDHQWCSPRVWYQYSLRSNGRNSGLSEWREKLNSRFALFWAWVGAQGTEQVSLLGVRQDLRRERVAFEMQSLGMLTEARSLYLDLAKDDAEFGILYSLGSICLRMEDLLDARNWLQKACDVDPNSHKAVTALATVYHRIGDLAEAARLYEKALDLESSYVTCLANYGLLCLELGDLGLSLHYLKNAVALDADCVDAHLNLSLALLSLGDYQSGLPEYEWRLSSADSGHLWIGSRLSRWDGVSPCDVLHLVAEQGLGDVIQFMRYIPLLRQRVGDLRFYVQDSLHNLVRAAGLHPSPSACEESASLTSGQWLPLLSLPAIFGVCLEDPIVDRPYVEPDLERSKYWIDAFASEKRPVIALHWQGNPSAEKLSLRGRSLPLDLFACLADEVSASFVSLQKGFGVDQLAVCSFHSCFVSSQDEVDRVLDFREIAAIISATDLVITSDSAVAHLSGAMGHPTWLLLHSVPDWRWGLNRDTTPWYPSMRLFRQRERGNWVEVLQRVAQELRIFCR